MTRTRAFLACLAVCAVSHGCSQPATSENPALPAERAVARVYGTEFIRPEEGAAIVLIAAKPWTPGGSITVSAGEAEITGAVHSLRISARAAPSWTGAPVEWSIGGLIEDELAPGASALAVLPPLPEGTTKLAIDGAEVRLEDPVDRWPAPREGVMVPPSPDLLGSELADPTRAWRVELAGALAGERAAQATSGALDQLSRQHAARWRTALSRLTTADGALASRLAASLGRVIQIDGRAVPAWSADHRRVDALLSALLAPEADDAQLKLAAESWLADEPDAVAWVIDDGGDERPSLIGIANLTDVRAAASISANGAVELAVVEARQAIQLPIAQPSGAPSVRAEVRVGESVIALDLVTEPIACEPPGVRMGPLLPEWTLPEWLGERAPSVDVGWATAGLLQPRPGRSGAWEVFVECRAAQNGEDTVVLTLGPPAKPHGAVRVSRSGAVEGSGALAGVKGSVREEMDRWTATLELPSGAMAQSVVTIGLERVDARGHRSTWPRRVTPWQRQLPGGEIDLSSWGGLENRETGGR